MGCKSYMFYPLSGVQQDSNLDPLLFLLLINDITISVRFSECIIFADNFKVYHIVSSGAKYLELQEDRISVQRCATQNEMFYNIDKCYVLSHLAEELIPCRLNMRGATAYWTVNM